MSSIGSFPFTPWCKSVGIMLIFYDRVNRASQKQEFRSQRASEPGRRKRILNNSLLARLNKQPKQLKTYIKKFSCQNNSKGIG